VVDARSSRTTDSDDPFPDIGAELNLLREKTQASVLYSDIRKYAEYYWKPPEWKDSSLYPYQVELANQIINPPKTKRVGVLASRQCGKSTCLIYTILYLLDKNPGFKIGVFAPKEEQAKGIIFKGVRDRAESSQYYSKKVVRSSMTHLELANGSLLKAQAASLTSHIMGQDLDIAIVDEAQDVPDDKFRKDIIPMLGARNGTFVAIGTASTKTCYFYEALKNPAYTQYRIKLEEACAQNKMYEEHVNLARLEKGEDDVLFRTQYLGEWVLDKGMFIERESLEACEKSDIVIDPSKPHYAGFDPAQAQDRSVLTIMNDRGQIVQWVSFDGDDYPSQFQMIIPILQNWNVVYMCVDNTGPQASVYQTLRAMARERGVQTIIEPRGFDPMGKHRLYTNLLRALKQREIAYWERSRVTDDQITHWHRFKTEMLDAEKSYRDYIMVVAAPDKAGHTDDYLASISLCWEAFTTFGKPGGRTGYKAYVPILSHDRQPMRELSGKRFFLRRRRERRKDG